MIRRLWQRRFWRPRIGLVIIGNESGHITPVPFVRFRTRRAAADWLLRHQCDNGLIHYEVRPIEGCWG
jgi:hypothetical protein